MTCLYVRSTNAVSDLPLLDALTQGDNVSNDLVSWNTMCVLATATRRERVLGLCLAAHKNIPREGAEHASANDAIRVTHTTYGYHGQSIGLPIDVEMIVTYKQQT